MSKNNHYKAGIPSDNDQENKREQEAPFVDIKEGIINRLEKNPRKTFSWMVGILAFCIVANILWAVLKTPEVPQKKQSTSLTPPPISNGFGELVNAGTTLNHSMTLKGEIEGLLNKENLTRQDSIKLLSLFEQLDELNRKLSPNPNNYQK